MSKTNKKEPKKNLKKKSIIALSFIILILGFFAGIGSGVLQYTFATIRCMSTPVAASDFMAGYTYELPGEKGYGPSIFNKYYCTEQGAKNAGFRHNNWTDAGAAEEKARQQTYEENKRFSLDKVDFKVYVPAGNGYTAGKMEISSMGANNDNRQVFFPIKKDGYVVTSAREGKAPNNYELCTGAEDSCEIVGADSSGHSIKKQVANSDIVSYGLTINDTFINLEGASKLSNQEVIAIFNSLTEYKGE
jgi:hypothetical protein